MFVKVTKSGPRRYVQLVEAYRDTQGRPSVVLPVSKQRINFGTDLYIRPDLSQFEGIGVKPDLWVPPGESLDRVIRFVKRFLNQN